jgi:2,4-dienoyl-CoA reductase-like NADH-dependent reductase (Old Yellow Enzyme family)
MSKLFSPINLRGLTLPNRIVVSPMCQYSAIDGCAQPWHLAHIGSMAISGAGHLLLEATAVEAIGRITHGCLGLYDQASEDALAAVIKAVRGFSDMSIGIQLGHAGRKGSSARPWEGGLQIPIEQGGWLTLAPSATPHNPHEQAPQAMSLADLAKLKQAFVIATERAQRLGLDSIEVHAAHGYLLHQFISPLSNLRSDQYGGSVANRIRYPLEVIEAMRRAWPVDKPLGVRLSASDWVDGGWDIEGSIEFAGRARELGVDWIDVSSGGVSPKQKIAIGPGYQLPFAAAIKAKVNMPVMAVGLITTASQAEEILNSGKADMVALARAMLYDPRWPWHAAAELGAKVSAPKPYWRSHPAAQKGLFGEAKTGQR